MSCPSCNSANLIKGECYREYTLYKCGACGLQFWTPLKHPGKEFYETSELHRIEGKKGLEWRHEQFIKNPPLRSGTLLDVACGTGEFLNAAKEKGFDVWGIDLSERQIKAAKEFHGLEHVYAEALDTFVERKDIPRFDVITFFEVLEHVDNPRAFFDFLKRIITPDGIIVFSVPNTRRIGMGKEPEETPPNHLLRWDRDSISNFLRIEGFVHEKIVEQPFSKPFFFTTGLFSFGLVKRVSQAKGPLSQNSAGISRKNSPLTCVIKRVANAKNKILLPVAAFLAFFPRALGLKYWDMYVVARLK